MKFIKIFLLTVFCSFIAACGGGGGEAGKTTGTSTSSNGSSAGVPSIALSIVDAAGATVASNSISNGATYYVKAVVRDATGGLVSQKRVSFTADATVATLSQASALTTNGTATVQISPAGLSANAGTVTATATIDSVAATQFLDFQTSAPNVTLSNLQVAPSSISAMQSSAITVDGRVNGTLAGSGVVAVNFSAGCGSFSPNPASTNSAGIVSTTYQSTVSCSGATTITAQPTGGGTTTSAVVTVAAAQPSNVVYKSATVPLMVSSAASAGLKQSTLTFQVLNNSGSGMAGVSVDFTLDSATQTAGVQFSVGGLATTAKQVVTTDGSGNASVTVTSGALPTPVVVTAALSSNATIQAKSTGVAVTAGRATQKAASLSATKLSIEGLNVDGVQTTLNFRVADRQGNPIPVGTVVNFVASHGMVQGTCTIDANSGCSVTYTSQGTRPTNGRAVVLAYLDGEESFTDQNGDNVWQSGEPFQDVGLLYRDDNENGTYDAATEQNYSGGVTAGTGSSTCSSIDVSTPWVANSCDGTWSASIRARKQITIALAGSDATVTVTVARSANGFSVRVADVNSNAMPTGTTVSAAVVTNGATCTVKSTSPGVVRNSSNAGDHSIILDGAADCTTVRVAVTVTTPAGIATVTSF